MTYGTSWAVRPSAASTEYFFAAGTVGGAGAVTLLQSTMAPNGAGYKLIFDSAGDSHLRTYTIVGTIVGQLVGTTTEIVTAPNATTGNSANYWARVDSITASGAMTGNQKIGFTGSLALPRCRILGVHYVGAASAGSIVVTMNGTSAVNEILGIDTPASAAFAEYVRTNSVIVGKSNAKSDYAVVTLTTVTKATLFLA